jgi:predicted Ser/Thr protein kinase
VLQNTQTCLRYPADVAGHRRDDLELEQTALAESTTKSSEPDLARTATAPVSSTLTPAEPIGATLGRYRLERELGAGGMGVVHAAFDPDLERRVALKVLRTTDDDGGQKQRLQREAKAMARLAHPNVVTVHEVGTVNGRDYVAMELIEGESLAEWLRAAKRPEAEIIDAYLAAGRGLAAAHAAGMVHRDFKPHNVLRSRAGRIAVTDFGLAREATADPFAATGAAPKRISAPKLATAASTTTGNTPSMPLAGLTMTGAILGTPAYMAPEQWAGGSVTAATDQFAFCVAVWEALAGERPFRADTAEMLRRAVELGPSPLDDSQIPRRLRAVLRRGLDPLPSRRWPSMDALLAAMAPPKRSSRMLAIGAGAVVAAAAVYLVAGRSPPAVPDVPVVIACPQPALDPTSIAIGGEPIAAGLLRADIDRWKTERQKACALEAAVRTQRVTCLDRVLSRLDAVAKGLPKLDAKAQPVDVGKYVIDPAVCAVGPRLEPASPALADAIAVALREDANRGTFDRDAVAQLLKRTGTDACATAWANILAAHIPGAERTRHLADAEQAAERCGDDRIRAETAIRVAAFTLGRNMFGIPSTAKVKVAAAAVERVSQPDLVAEIDSLLMQHASKSENLGEAIELGDRAMVGYSARGRIGKQIMTGLEVYRLRGLRSTADDRKRMGEQLAEWHTLATTKLGATHPTTRQLEMALAMEAFTAGDASGAQQKLEKLREVFPLERPRKMQIKVVEGGKPIAGATVTAGPDLWGAGTAAAFPDPSSHSQRTGVTSDAGELVLEAPADGMVIAQLGDRRSRVALIADSVTLVLEPTSRLEGKVDLRGEDARRVIIAVSDKNVSAAIRYELIAPLNADGTFVLEGVPRTKVQLFAQLQAGTSRSVATIDLQVAAPVMRDVKIAVANHGRTIHVVIRSTVDAPVGGAQVIVQPGTIASMTLDKFRLDGSAAIRFAKPADDKTPAAVKALLRSGDVVAAMTVPATKTATACALGVPAEVDDIEFDRKVRGNLARIQVRCVPIAAGAETVTVEVPPWPRLE